MILAIGPDKVNDISANRQAFIEEDYNHIR